MYRTPYSLTHTAGPLLKMNAHLDIILIKVQSIFSSFACSAVSKGFFINVFPSILLHTPLPLLLFKLKQGTSGVERLGWHGRCRWVNVKVESWKCNKIPLGWGSTNMAEVGEEEVVSQRWDRCYSVMVCYSWQLHVCICTHAKGRGRVSHSHWGGLFNLQVGWSVKGAANRRDCLVSGDERRIRGHLCLGYTSIGITTPPPSHTYNLFQSCGRWWLNILAARSEDDCPLTCWWRLELPGAPPVMNDHLVQGAATLHQLVSRSPTPLQSYTQMYTISYSYT